VSVSIKKIEGVESVDVSLNQGLAVVRLKAGNTVSLEQVRKSVEDNGFTPKGARITALGQVLLANGKPQFNLAGCNQTFDLMIDSKAEKLREDVQKHAGKTVLIEGLISDARPSKPSTQRERSNLAGGKAPPVIQLKSIKQA
jgi:copper chaperone CopZ